MTSPVVVAQVGATWESLPHPVSRLVYTSDPSASWPNGSSENAVTKIDIVVTDLIMPGMSGRELVQAIHQIRPNLKALYVSGYTEDEIVRQPRRRLDSPLPSFYIA